MPLTISEPRVSCSCTTVTLSAKTVPPKESVFLDVSMDARRFTGPKTVDIYVSVGPQYTSTATLHVSANSRADVVCNPGQVNFGVVASGQTPTQTMDIEYAGNLDWKITGVADHAALPLEGKVEELYRQPGPITKVGYRLSATLKANAPAGAGRWEILLQSNDPASPNVPVLLEATVQASLEVSGQVKFSNAKVGTETSFRVVVRGSKPFRILAVEGQGDGLVVEGPSEAREVHVVQIKWKPATAGDFRRELKFKTDLDGGAVATVPVEGAASP